MTERFAPGLNMGCRTDFGAAAPGWALGDSGVATGSVISNAPPVFSLSQIVAQLRTSWGGQWEGAYFSWFSSNVTYSIADSYPANGSYVESGAYIMSAVMKATARLGFELWDDAIAINLNESVNDPAANITTNWADQTQGGGTYARTFFGLTPSGGTTRSRRCKSG